MPANLTPQYNEAEERFKKAKSAEERLDCLKEMLRLLPKHKGTEKIQAELKSKISNCKDEVEKEKAKSAKAGVSFKIPKQGAGQILLLGGPNVGKSSLLAKLTKATPEIAPYPFTTREPQPGMMEWEDVRVQLVDTPPITADYLENWLGNMVKSADAVALIADLADDDGAAAVDAVLRHLFDQKTELVPDLPGEDSDSRVTYVRTLVVGNKAEDPAATDRLEFLKESLGNRFEVRQVSALTGAGIEELRTTLYRFLRVLRVYSKQPGKPPDLTSPFTLPVGGTVHDFAGVVHRELQEKLKSARIWGTGVFEGQTVKRDHVLHDKDVVELHS